MRRVTIAVALAGPLLAGTFIQAGIANADSGDGSLACNAGEICFNRDGANLTYQKHFWYSGDHSGYTFTNVSTGATGQGYLRDNAYSVKNRDSSCNVKVVDDRGIYPDDYQTIDNNNSWTTLISSVRDQNDRHERC
jgi:transposase